MKARTRVLPLLLVPLALGCTATGHSQSVQAELVRTQAQCPLITPNESPALYVLNDATQWATTLRAQPATLLGREPRWADERVVVFSLGRQPTLGVSVALQSPQLAINGNTLDFAVKVQRPGPDQMAAMALSWPCVMATVPRAGWGTARVLDAQGVELVGPTPAR